MTGLRIHALACLALAGFGRAALADDVAPVMAESLDDDALRRPSGGAGSGARGSTGTSSVRHAPPPGRGGSTAPPSRPGSAPPSGGTSGSRPGAGAPPSSGHGAPPPSGGTHPPGSHGTAPPPSGSHGAPPSSHAPGGGTAHTSPIGGHTVAHGPVPSGHGSGYVAHPGAVPRPAHGGLMVVPPGHFAPYHASYHPHFLFPRWQPGFHRVVPVSYPHWQPRYWGRGVFIYSPPPGRVVVGGQTRTVDGGGDSSRAVDRNGDFGVGLLAGTYSSSYQGGVGGYGDFGMGLALSYRPVESLGLHLDWTRHSETFDEESERQESPLAASVNLYAFPWTRVSPYLTTGLTFTSRNIHDTYFNGVTYVEEDQQDTLYGPHIGLGLELAIGSNAAIDVEGRYAGYLNVDHDDSSTAGALQGNVGLSMYF